MIRTGAAFGLKPNDIMDMEYWEFNNYIIGYKAVLKREQEYIVTLAYQTAGFTNSKRKVKPLKHYLEKISSAFNKKSNDKVDMKKAKQVEETIAFLKKRKEENK